ncbi:MAG: selenocysteine-specific translation elongation factor [Gammaproteobacteria bacterium]|jgi:selenocysteine-specific elongation factor|nr:selenocysteine-specific translation elongation factor [Gammaproteobacteria bacterium]
MAESSSVDNILSEKSLIVATAGHVDHGKTALIRHITGTDTDTLSEEKARGFSINLGYAYYHFSNSVNGQSFNNTIGFVDVPGHSDFINNMLAGVGTVDYALLVVAADDGIMPQTREHLAILDLLGISSGVVALSKVDKCDESRIQFVSKEITALLASTSLRDAPIFQISNISGQGIEELTCHLQNVINSRDGTKLHSPDHNARLLIDRSFTVKGIGTVITGSVRAGNIKVGDSVLHTGSGQETKIRGLRQDNKDIERVDSGQRTAANIGINVDAIKRGDWLIQPELYMPIQRFDACIKLIEPEFTLLNSAQYHLHLGAAHHIVTVRCIDEQAQLFQVASHEPMIANFGDRFILRDPASQHTIGGGNVLDIFVPRRKRTSETRIKVLYALNNKSLEALSALLQLSPQGIDLDQFVVCRNISQCALQELLDSLDDKGSSFSKLAIEKRRFPTLLDGTYFSAYKRQILDQIQSFHSVHSNQQGISETALSKAINFEASHRLLHAILQVLIDEEIINRTGTLLHLPTHELVLSMEESAFLAKVHPLLVKAGNIPPRTRELVEQTGIPLQNLEQILKQISKAGNLIRVAENRYYLPETIMALAEFTEQLAETDSDGTGFSVIQFRDASGIGRNLCIEILEYFDRIGFTRRDGNSRYLRTDKKNIFGS